MKPTTIPSAAIAVIALACQPADPPVRQSGTLVQDELGVGSVRLWPLERVEG